MIPVRMVVDGVAETHQYAGKRIAAPWAAGRVLCLVSHLETDYGPEYGLRPYLERCFYTVIDYGSGVMVGGGHSKAEAIAFAKDVFKDRARLRKQFMEGRLALRVYYAKVAVEIAEFQASLAKYKRSDEEMLPAKRRRVFLQSGKKCHYCKVDLEAGGDWQVDHYVSRYHGGPDTLANLVAACKPCNQSKGRMNGDEFLIHLRKVQQIAA